MAPGAYMYIYTPYNHTHTYARTYKYIYVGICCFYALFICFRGYHAICINCPNPLIYFTLLICLNTFPHDTVAVAFESPPFLHRHRACHGWNGCNGICPAFVYIQKPDKLVLYCTLYTVQHSVASAPVVTGSVSTYAGIQIIFGTVHADFIAAIFYVKF